MYKVYPFQEQEMLRAVGISKRESNKEHHKVDKHKKVMKAPSTNFQPNKRCNEKEDDQEDNSVIHRKNFSKIPCESREDMTIPILVDCDAVGE
uniref:Uncharacterized protein n=1 Tax=Romanomermis culicivorax TaxID=13658 RepID=A0A915KHL3_ROMCU